MVSTTRIDRGQCKVHENVKFGHSTRWVEYEWKFLYVCMTVNATPRNMFHSRCFVVLALENISQKSFDISFLIR